MEAIAGQVIEARLIQGINHHQHNFLEVATIILINMQCEIVKEKVKGVAYITPNNAQGLYNFILKNKLTNILELGIAHGTASCYMAVVLGAIGGGKLVCEDLLDAAPKFVPSIETQISSLGINKYVDIHRIKSGYNWFLHNEIMMCSQNNNHVCLPKYDLIVIDGPQKLDDR